MPVNDPLKAKHLRAPGIWELVQGLINGTPKIFDVLQVEVSSACPARCTYCPHTTQASRWKSAFMEDTTYAKLWPLFKEAKRVHLQGWGEPFLHKRFFDFVELARRADCRVSTTSCGLTMTEDLAVKLVKSGVDIVAFSLAGTSAEGNTTRQGAPFEKVCAGIKLLQKVRQERMAVHLEVHLAYLVLASQIEDMHGIPALLEELGVHQAVVSTMDFIPSPELAHEAFMPWEQEKIAKARAVLEEVQTEAAKKGREVYYSLPAPEPRSTCLEAPERCLYVAVDGSISPCIYVNLPLEGEDPLRRVYGNVNVDNPLQVWNSPAFKAFRQGLADMNPDENCKSCPKRYAVGNRE